MISVIVPYRDSAQWIERCALSLKNQRGDFEFIFVDDHSRDNGKEILRKIADSRFVMMDNHRKPGVSGARNTGLDIARGEWITFLDADDEMLAGAYDVFRYELGTDADIHQFNHVRYYTVIDKQVIKYSNKGGWYDISRLPVCWFGVWNKLFRASFLKDIRFDEGLQYGEDGLFIIECLTKCRRIHHAPVRKVAVRHRFDNKNSLSHIKTVDDMIMQADAYEQAMKRMSDIRMTVLVSRELSILWDRISKELKYGI